MGTLISELGEDFSDSWVLIDNLTGPQGPQGVQGPAGQTGPAGTPASNSSIDTHLGGDATNLVPIVALKAPINSPAFTGTPTGITKAHVGLGNVDNTTDLLKPISTAQAAVNSNKADLVSGLVPLNQLPDRSPLAVPASFTYSASNVFTLPSAATFLAVVTLNGLVLQSAEYALTTPTTVTVVPTDGITLVTGDKITIMYSLTPAAAAGAVAGEPVITPGTNLQFWRGDKIWTAIDKVMVGLPNVDNTSDVNKPVSAAQAAANTASVLLSRTATMNLRQVVTPSGTDDTAAVNAALAAFDAAGGGRIVIPRDNWKFTGATGLALINTANSIHIEAEEGTVFDMTGSTADTGITLGGSVTGSVAALGANANRFDETITCGLTVLPGDIVKIESTDIFVVNIGRNKGELAEVLSSAAGVITLKSGLWDSYLAATTTVTKMQMPEVSVTGLTVTRNSNQAGLVVQYARHAMLGGLVASGARERLFMISNVFGATVDSCYGRDFWYAGTGTSYGLSVASCQDVVERANNFKGGRHGTTHGGTFPTRNVQVHGGIFDNYHPSGQACFDFHSNCENVRLTNVTMLNGLISQASNFDASGLTIRTSSTTNRTGAELTPCRSSDYIQLRNCDIQASGTAVDAVSVLARDGSNPSTTKRVEVSGYIVASTGGVAVRVFPATSSDTGSSVDELIVDGHLIGAGGFTMQPAGAAELTVKRAKVSGRITALTAHGVTVSTLNCTRIILDGDIVTKTATKSGYSGVSTGTMEVILQNGRLASEGVTGDRNYFGAGRLIIANEAIEGFGAVGGLAASTVSEALISNARFTGNAGTPSLPARHYYLINAAGKVVTYGSVAPTAGTWAVGDSCSDTTGGPGWICTTAGTPGTWASANSIDGGTF